MTLNGVKIIFLFWTTMLCIWTMINIRSLFDVLGNGHIIANSSSWWFAYLGGVKNCFMKNWFGPKGPKKLARYLPANSRMENIVTKKFEKTYWNVTMHQTDFHKQFVDWVGEADAESKSFLETC